MSWQLASFAILAVALAGGFAWYERSVPDARTIALVGTLAAFAVLGRVAFAALPNVKPTTDIVLIAGYALGGAPGFVVGAVTGLTSNFFFGQGPWTPWQMAAWAVCGLLGALMARVERRPAGRWRLAVVCGLVGYGFAALQDFGDWVNYSDHSAAQLAVYVGKGTGFDVIHAAGCLGFALAFGPALARSLRRFDQRLHVSWRAPEGLGAPLAAVILLAAAGLLTALAPTRAARAGGTPAGYLAAAQNADGGFGAAPGAPSTTLFAGWAALGLAAGGRNPADVSHRGPSLLAYLQAEAGRDGDAGSIERTILAVRAAGADARDIAGVDFLARLRRAIRADGSVARQVNLTAFAILALRAAGAPAPAASLRWLLRQQDADGGFNYSGAGATSDADDTGAVLEALAGAGGAGPARARAVAFLRRDQNRDGGFPDAPGATSNAQSTAFAVQGLLAARVAPGALHAHSSPSPLGYLRSLIAPDGHVRYARGSDQTPVWVTGEAAMALAARPLPIAPVARAVPPAPAAARPAGSTRAPTGAARRDAARRRARAGRHAGATGRAPAHGTPGGSAARAPRGRRAAARAAAWIPVDTAFLAALALAPVGL